MMHPLHAQDVEPYGAGFGVLEGDGALRLVGELDLATVGALEDALEPYVRRWGALDLVGLEQVPNLKIGWAPA